VLLFTLQEVIKGAEDLIQLAETLKKQQEETATVVQQKKQNIQTTLQREGEELVLTEGNAKERANLVIEARLSELAPEHEKLKVRSLPC
jgi:hypothetical protein